MIAALALWGWNVLADLGSRSVDAARPVRQGSCKPDGRPAFASALQPGAAARASAHDVDKAGDVIAAVVSLQSFVAGKNFSGAASASMGGCLGDAEVLAASLVGRGKLTFSADSAGPLLVDPLGKAVSAEILLAAEA